MTPKEQDAFRLIERGLEFLRSAIEKGVPHNELQVRADHLLRDVRAIAWPDLVYGRDVHAITPRTRYYRKGIGYR
jgi:hypothetical protein